jgi:hypothetical protein
VSGFHRGLEVLLQKAGYKTAANLSVSTQKNTLQTGGVHIKFFDMHAASGSPVAEEALRRIVQLYAIEQQASGWATADRRALREQHALPALGSMHAWLLTSQRTVAVGSATAKAIDHALKRWPALQRYASSGSLPIDNNPGRERDPSHRHRQEELAVCWFGTSRLPRSRDPEPVRHCQTKWT